MYACLYLLLVGEDYACESQRTTLWNWFFPSTMGIKPRSPDFFVTVCDKYHYLLSAEPSCWPPKFSAFTIPTSVIELRSSYMSGKCSITKPQPQPFIDRVLLYSPGWSPESLVVLLQPSECWDYRQLCNSLLSN